MKLAGLEPRDLLGAIQGRGAQRSALALRAEAVAQRVRAMAAGRPTATGGSRGGVVAPAPALTAVRGNLVAPELDEVVSGGDQAPLRPCEWMVEPVFAQIKTNRRVERFRRRGRAAGRRE